MNGTRVVGGIPANELQYRMLVSGPWESQLNRLFPKRSNGGRRARDGRLRAAPVLSVGMFVLACRDPGGRSPCIRDGVSR